MAKKKKKKSQAFTMVMLLLVIILLVIGYFVATSIAKKSDNESSKREKDVQLIHVDTSKAQSLTYTINNNEYTLLKQGDSWVLQGETERPLDQTKVQEMVDCFKQMAASKMIAENQDNLKSVGLDNPTLKVSIKLEDGATYQYATGGAVVTEDGGCYAIVQGFPGVYVLPQGYFKKFTEDFDSITQLPKVSGILANQITKIHIIKDGEERFCATMDSKKENNAWTITAPYDSSVVMDDMSIASLATRYVTYIFVKNIDYNCKDMSQYGLATPKSLVEIEYYTKDDSGKQSSHSFVMHIGDQTEDGAYTYVRLDDSNSVYTISTAAISNYTNIKAFDFIQDNLITTSTKNLKKANFTVGTKQYELIRNGDGFTFNGAEKASSEVGVLYGKVTLLQVIDQVKDQVKKDSAVMSLSVTDQDNKETSYTFYEYDSNNYAIEHEGHTYFLIDQRRIEDLITALEDF